jgi:ABC-type Zn uptake system ZnuABC Zn-binding protein ZnuA
MLHGYIGTDRSFDDIMIAYAERYADITARDHARLREAIDDGVIKAIRDI